MTVTVTDLERLEVLARAATPGPWRYEPSWNNAGIPLADFYIPSHNSGAAVEMMETDAAYIVACNPTVVLELIERLRRAEARPVMPTSCQP